MEIVQNSIIELVSEECPKVETLGIVLGILAKSPKISLFSSVEIDPSAHLLPIFDKDDKFSYRYQLLGVNIQNISKIFITIGRGTGSFVDYIMFSHTQESAVGNSIGLLPLALIEVTKTTDSESRNSAASQRLSKFASLRTYYKDCPSFMVYDAPVQNGKSRTPTALHGDRILKTMEVEVYGSSNEDIEPFNSVEDFLSSRRCISRPTSGHPIEAFVKAGIFYISIKLDKKENKKDNFKISHDPNIGYLSGVVYILREKLKWTGEIQVISHNVKQEQQSKSRGNKLSRLLNIFKVDLKDIKLPSADYNSEYWEYDQNTEKIATILTSTLVRAESHLDIVYENHAGSERGYFTYKNDIGNEVKKTIPKRVDGKNVTLPDVVFADHNAKKIYILEGEMGKKQNIANGLKQLQNFQIFSENFVRLYYPEYKICFGIIVNGGSTQEVEQWCGTIKPFLHIDAYGKVKMGDNCLEIFDRN